MQRFPKLSIVQERNMHDDELNSGMEVKESWNEFN